MNLQNEFFLLLDGKEKKTFFIIGIFFLICLFNFLYFLHFRYYLHFINLLYSLFKRLTNKKIKLTENFEKNALHN